MVSNVIIGLNSLLAIVLIEALMLWKLFFLLPTAINKSIRVFVFLLGFKKIISSSLYFFLLFRAPRRGIKEHSLLTLTNSSSMNLLFV